MLTTGKKGMTASQTIDYYTKDLANPDYYLDDNVLSYWSGKLAEQFELSGEVERDDLFAVVKNRHPQTGEKLKPRERANMRASQDFTVSAGKDISLLYTFTKDDEVKKDIQDSLINANNTMLKEMEKMVQTRTHRGLATKNVNTYNMLFSSHLQSTSRPVSGIVTPQLHIHNLAKNITVIDDKYRAADLKQIMLNRPYLQQVFHNELAKQLIDKGFPITRENDHYHITGISREAVDAFSLRTKQIEAFCEANHITDPKIKGDLGAKIRDSKTSALPKEQQLAYWNHALPDDTRKVIDNIRNDDSGTPHISASKALAHALEHELQNVSKVDEKRLLATAIKYGIGSVNLETLRAEYAAQNVLIDLEKGRRIITTQSIWEEEQSTKNIVGNGRWQYTPFTRQDVTVPEFFNKKQYSAMKRVLKSTDIYTPIKGQAGTGKTTVLKAVADVIEKDKDVIALTPTNSAKDKLKEDGFANTHTVDKFLYSKALQEQFKDQVIMLDEAGMVGWQNMSKLMRIVKDNNMRVIAVGDEKQHNSVPRGDAFRVLNKDAGLRPIILDEIIRQKPQDYRKAVRFLSRGEVAFGVNQLDKMGAIQEAPVEEIHKRAAHDYVSTINKGRSALVVAPTHIEKDKVTTEIRQALKANGKISEQERLFEIHKVMHLTNAEKKDVRNYEQGQHIHINQNMQGFTKGERVTVTGISGDEVMVANKEGEVKALDIDKAKRFNFYDTESIPLAKGDIIRTTKGGTSQTKSQKQYFANNSRIEIEGFTSDGDIRLPDGRIISKEFGNIDYGFVTTSHKSQGQTVDKVIVSMGDDANGQASNMEQFYVSVSRGRYGVSIYTSNKEELLEQVKKSNERKSATELFKERHGFWSDKLQQVVDHYQRTQAYLEQMKQNTKDMEMSR